MKAPLRLVRRSFPGSDALDTAVSRAMLQRVAAGEMSETFRISRPPRVVAFGRRDVASPTYREAVAAARGAGFGAIERLAGGRAAVFHEQTIAISHALPADDPTTGIQCRFETSARLFEEMLVSLGVDAGVGEVPGEYCPGEHSVHARGVRKIVGIGQRLVAHAVHIGGVIVVDGSDDVRDALIPVYDALDLEWDPATAGSIAEEVPGITVEDVVTATVEVLGRERDIVEDEVDEATLALARSFEGEHLSPDSPDSPDS